MALKETAGLYETLKTEWNKKNPNLNKCGDLLSKLKVKLCLSGAASNERLLFVSVSTVSTLLTYPSPANAAC